MDIQQLTIDLTKMLLNYIQESDDMVTLFEILLNRVDECGVFDFDDEQQYDQAIEFVEKVIENNY